MVGYDIIANVTWVTNNTTQQFSLNVFRVLYFDAKITYFKPPQYISKAQQYHGNCAFISTDVPDRKAEQLKICLFVDISSSRFYYKYCHAFYIKWVKYLVRAPSILDAWRYPVSTAIFVSTIWPSNVAELFWGV